ncbi:MAG: hypothetical protein CO094_13015 [Anaerolineae bacterium CG_4_9_14_3_um_filter_57_17]|nr:hypothetical protein [bacterium]NCT21254.1 hypothetical protein [bacterium]OIO86469.1 MAG: hypothetical protein AUK01_03035 [Anaerolineae bacterium CG2_30_57_67]PJB64450.1 MAG: hypothetical protein CO094_13015 [Anaerolineae bacterium CG_4_9_14_3_um_filter_57_17]
MPIDNILQEANQIATLAGILAGFAFSAVVQLLAGERKGRLTSAVIIIFTLATLMFLFTIFAFVLIGAATAELNQQIASLDGLGTWAFLVAVIGFVFFLAGVGLSGWIRSTVTGIATSVFALITFCLALWAFIVVMSAFV